MSGTKISGLPSLSTLADASAFPVVDSTINYKLTASALATYFHVIVTRLCLDRMRVNRAVRFDLSEELQDLLEDESQNPFKDLQAAQSSSLIQKAMMSIKPRQRAVLTLWAYQDATMSEIAEMMELEVNAVHQLLHRAKINLREKLEGLGYETS